MVLNCTVRVQCTLYMHSNLDSFELNTNDVGGEVKKKNIREAISFLDCGNQLKQAAEVFRSH